MRPTLLVLLTAALGLSAAPAVAAGQLRLTCAQRSIGEFGTGFGHPANLTAGPLALIGAGSPAPEQVVAELGGTKFPAVVRPGRTVTVSGPRRPRRRGAP